MPRNTLEFRVVIASPSDVFEARKSAFEGIHELNRIFEAQSISIRALGWEEYASPGIGPSAQEVISEQILREYDILIAILGTKLGTPTPNARSGTVEEIENAIARESPLGKFRVQVYFLDKIESASAISLDDLKSVADFRNQLADRGILYKLYKDQNELQKEVRINVQRSIIEYLNAAVDQKVTEPPSINSQNNVKGTDETSLTTQPAENDFGLLDLQERGEEAMESAAAAINRMNALILEINAATEVQTSEMERLNLSGPTVKGMKKSVDEFASFLDSKAANLKQEAYNARENFSVYAQTVVAIAALQRQTLDEDQYQKDVTSLLANVEPILESLPTNRQALMNFRSTIQNVPRITAHFNRAKRNLIDALDECILLHDQTEQSIYEIAQKV